MYRVSGENKSVCFPPCEVDFFHLPAVGTCNLWVWLLIKALSDPATLESLWRTEQLTAFMLSGGRHVRGAHIIWLQRLQPVKDYHTQKKTCQYKQLIKRAGDDRKHVIRAKIYLPARCYPTTKGTGLDRQRNKRTSRLEMDREEERERV